VIAALTPVLVHLPYIIFVFAIGACVGSFLNVVVYRLPLGQSLITPPSHCPQCNRRLKWYDNLPIVGWIKLGGRCRYCREPISPRYPIVEAVTACLFAGYYIAFYVMQWRSCCPLPMTAQGFDSAGQIVWMNASRWVLADSWPLYALFMFMISSLLAASLIDAELYIIPAQIPWIVAGVALVVHALADRPTVPGSLNLLGSSGVPLAALSAGGAVGLAISGGLLALGWLPTSFPQGEPMLEVDRAALESELEAARKAGKPISPADQEPLPPHMEPWQIRREMRKEIAFLLPPLLLGGLLLTLSIVWPAAHRAFAGACAIDWLSGLLGSLLGAMTGAAVVWLTRILGTLGFGRVAMGLGDVHLMFGVGAVIGAAGATVAFFIAPFFGILIAIYMLITRRGREMPLGPYLSLASAAVMLWYCPILAYLTPGLRGLILLVGGWFGANPP
jgi:leader peptidase (prepilin peptidase)/N-methyltransferase